jgi:hypothetical protein
VVAWGYFIYLFFFLLFSEIFILIIICATDDYRKFPDFASVFCRVVTIAGASPVKIPVHRVWYRGVKVRITMEMVVVWCA